MTETTSDGGNFIVVGLDEALLGKILTAVTGRWGTPDCRPGFRTEMDGLALKPT